MNIAFAGEAGDTYDRVLGSMHGFIVRITPEDGSEPFDAELIDSNNWVLEVRKLNSDEEPDGEPFEVEADTVYVY